MSFEGYSGLPSDSFITPEQARIIYGLTEREVPFPTVFVDSLKMFGIAKTELSVSESDIDRVMETYEICLDEFPSLIGRTYHQVDPRRGYTAGNVRRERKVHPITGVQTEDPKDVFHFTEFASRRWADQFTPANSPAILRRFLAEGRELYHATIPTERGIYAELEQMYPNISRAYFAEVNGVSLPFGFLRLGSYDSYPVNESDVLADVAKRHFDISGGTLHMRTDAPGFAIIVDGVVIPIDTGDKFGYFFTGNGHEKMYGTDTQIKATEHKVTRIAPEGLSVVPKRHVTVKFIEPPLIDFGTTLADTVPHTL